MENAVIPSLHKSPPFWLKGACVLACRFPLSKGYSVTHAHVLGPVLLTVAVLFSVYAHPFFFSSRQHARFIPHMVAVCVSLFTYCNCVMVLLGFDVGVAAFTSLACSVHLLYWTARGLRKIAPVALVPHQGLTASIMEFAMYAQILLAWTTVPHLNVECRLMLFALFVPEATGLFLELLCHCITFTLSL
jgi:hypothetical protein